QTNVIYTRYRGGAPASPPGEYRRVDVGFYDVALPSLPMEVGQWVEIVKIKEGQEYSPLEAENHYRTQKTGIEGPIIGVKAVESDLVEFVVRNETPGAIVSHAYLTVPKIDGVTMHLEWWRRVLWAMVNWTIPKVRTAQYEDNAIPHNED
ncbi:hypothetical protein C8Q79DRAFT_872946, partial [Trametes meyenii]